LLQQSVLGDGSEQEASRTCFENGDGRRGEGGFVAALWFAACRLWRTGRGWEHTMTKGATVMPQLPFVERMVLPISD